MLRPLAVLLLLTLAACSSTPKPRPASVPVAPVVRVVPPPPVAPPVVRPRPGPGPVDVIGHDARALSASFGPPRLDIQEPTVRKLQFANGSCVMDVYLYAPETGKEPLATHIDTRSPSGLETDRTNCAESLRKK